MPKRVSSSVSLAAPIGGWNARDSLANMDQNDAVTMINAFPSTSTVIFRKGYSQYATGLGAQVETLMAYSSGTARKFFAAAGTSFYDISIAGAVGSPVETGLTNARWQYVNISTSGGNFLLAVNGVDKLRGFDGTNWYADGDGSHDITGLDTSTISNINLFKNRIWLIQRNSLKAWYLGTNSISGAANPFDFQSVARRGGHLVAMGTWTLDAGAGMDDYAVFITSEGEVIVYNGTDPTSSATWALTGVYQIGSPIGNKCFFKWQGDLLLITYDGVVPLSSALQSSRVNPKVAITDKIMDVMGISATNYGSNFGWQITFYAKANMLILNVPINTGNDQQQYVMNTITRAWGQFNGWNANCWEIFGDEPYYGGNGFVGRAWDTFYDNGMAISSVVKQAFNYFGSRGILKRWTSIRPILLTNGGGNITAQSILNIDFDDNPADSLISFSTPTTSLWDTAVWDIDKWAQDLYVQKSWQGARGVGYAAAPRIEAVFAGVNLQWVSTDIVFERGAIL